MKRGSIVSGGKIPGPESQGNFPEGRQRGSGTSRGPAPPARPPAASAQAVGLLLLGLAACPASQEDAGGREPQPRGQPKPRLPGRSLPEPRARLGHPAGLAASPLGRRGQAGTAGSGKGHRGPRGDAARAAGGVNPRPHLVAARVHCTEPCWRGRGRVGVSARSRVAVHACTGVARSRVGVHICTSVAQSRVSVRACTGVHWAM